MARIHLWVGAFLLLCSKPWTACGSDIAAELAPSGEAVDLADYVNASVSRMGPVPISGLGKVSRAVDYFFGAFLPTSMNPARHMAIREAAECFAGVDNSALDGLHPASSTAATVDHAAAAWFYCSHTGNLVQTMSSTVLASDGDANMVSPLIIEDGVEVEKDTNEDADIDAFLDEFFTFSDDKDDDDGFGKGLYLHGSQPAVCPASSVLPPIAPVLDPSLAALFFDSGSEFEPRWKQQRAVIGDKIRLVDFDDFARGEFLAEACPAVATREIFTLEDLVAAGDKREQERKTLEAGLEEVEKSLARGILGVVENVAGYVGSLFKEILPAWINPTAGQVQRADECFRVVGSMSAAPGQDPCATEPSCLSSPSDAAFISTTSHAGSTALNASAAADYRGGGWFYCSHHKRLVQLDPTFICPSNGKAGRSVEPSSPASLTGQDDSYDADEDEVGSLISALLAADRTRYEAEHMKLALHVDPALHFPAAVEALLSRHIAELEDERAWVEALLDGIFERDEEDERQVALERNITTQMQHLLSGGVDKDREEEEPLPPVCQEDEYYTFVPVDGSKAKCKALPDFPRTPPMDGCSSLTDLYGNDQYVTSRGDCRLYMHKHPFRNTPVSVEENFAPYLFYDTAASPFNYPEYLYDTPGETPQLPGQPWVVERLLERLPESLVTAVTGALTDARQVVEVLQLKLEKTFDLICSLAGGGSGGRSSVKYIAKGGEAVHMKSFVKASVERTAPAAVSQTVDKFARIVDSRFGVFLPDKFNPVRLLSTRRADTCFQEADSMLGHLLSASPAAVAVAEKASEAAGNVAGDTSSVWFYCAHTQSLVQLDPAALAARGNALSLSPLLFFEGSAEEEEEEGGIGGRDEVDGDIKVLRRNIDNEGGSILNADADGDDDDINATDGHIVTDDSVTHDTGDRISHGDSVTDGTDKISGPTITTATTTIPGIPATTTIVTSSPETSITVATGDGQTATITFSADTPTVGTHTTTIVYST